MLESSQHGFRGSQSVQLVLQKERWLLNQAMKQDFKLIRVDLDLKNAFDSACHSSLWELPEGVGVSDVSLLSSIYEPSSMQILVGDKSSPVIQLDKGTVQGSALSPRRFPRRFPWLTMNLTVVTSSKMWDLRPKPESTLS